LEETTVRNSESPIGGDTGIKRNGGSLKHEEMNHSGNLNDSGTVIEKTTVRNLESTIEENTGIEMSGSLLEHEKVNISASLVHFAEEFHAPFCNFDIALRDTVETTMGGTTVRNPICEIQHTMDWMKGSKDYEFSVSAANKGKGVAVLLWFIQGR